MLRNIAYISYLYTFNKVLMHFKILVVFALYVYIYVYIFVSYSSGETTMPLPYAILD